jgi:histidinol-phosphatase (PHP family)
MLIDYHIHTHASFDCFTTTDRMCQAAIDAGMAAVAFTDHVDYLPGHGYDWQTDLDAAYREIDDTACRFAGTLEVARGVEIGQPQFNEGEAKRFLKKHRPDFIIGSVHYLDPTYDMGMSGVADREPHQLFRQYLAMVTEMVRSHEFDVVGHLTYPWRYFKRELDYDYDADDYTEQFTDIFDLLVARGKGIEINTSGLRQALADTLPNEQILRLFHRCGGRYVTTGSDAHTPEHVGGGIAQATEMIRRVGIKGITTYKDRIPTVHPFASEGPAPHQGA